MGTNECQNILQKIPCIIEQSEKTFFNMHTDGKIEDQGNAIEDLKGVEDCCVREHNCCHYCQWWPESKRG